MPWSKLAFSAITLAFAAMHKWLGFDTLSVGLGAAAAAPWILPELQTLVKSLKVNGVLEMEFRDLQQKVEAQQVALETGVGGKQEPVPAAAVRAAAASGGARAYAGPMAAEDAPPSEPDDPNKGHFGGKASADGLRLSATVTPFPGSNTLFRVRARVDGLTAGDPTTFHLHPTFRRRVLESLADADGVAAIEVVAWGAFTLGAVASHSGRETRLELDLAHLAGAPAEFRAR